MKYNFSGIGDAELLRMEINLEEELNSKIVNMMIDEEMEEISDKLEALQVEKEERGL